MKKVAALFIAVATFVVACTPKASPSATEALIPAESRVKTDKTTIDAGQVISSTSCTKCHREKDYSRATYEELRPVLASMVKKAKLDEKEIQQISAYVHSQAKK